MKRSNKIEIGGISIPSKVFIILENVSFYKLEDELKVCMFDTQYTSGSRNWSGTWIGGTTFYKRWNKTCDMVPCSWLEALTIFKNNDFLYEVFSELENNIDYYRNKNDEDNYTEEI